MLLHVCYLKIKPSAKVQSLNTINWHQNNWYLRLIDCTGKKLLFKKKKKRISLATKTTIKVIINVTFNRVHTWR